MVVISLPAALLIGVTQDRIALPPSLTVQAPQRPTPQPNLVPISPNSSRRYQSRGICGSPSKDFSTPLTLRRIIGLPRIFCASASLRGIDILANTVVL